MHGFSRIYQLPTVETILWWICKGYFMTISSGIWQACHLILPHVTFIYGVIEGQSLQNEPQYWRGVNWKYMKEILKVPQEELLQVNFNLFK
jgi:hypothetical protein